MYSKLSVLKDSFVVLSTSEYTVLRNLIQLKLSQMTISCKVNKHLNSKDVQNGSKRIFLQRLLSSLKNNIKCVKLNILTANINSLT